MTTNPAASSAITIADLHQAYGQHPVLVGVKWEVPAGAVTALLGPSGAGKSTLLAVLAGALKPDRGQVRVGGGDPWRTDTRRLIGFMPQMGGLYGDLTVEDNLRIFAAGMGARVAIDELVEKTLEVIALRSRRHEVVKTLSGGHQARVSLGAALVAQPSVLLLDEPLAQADPEFTERVWAHLRELAGKGRTVLVATCHPHVAAMAERVGVMRAGRLVSQGETRALAAAGKAAVKLSYREKTGPLVKEVTMQDYRQELPNYVHGAVAKPYSIEIQPETVESQLTRLITEEPSHAHVGG